MRTRDEETSELLSKGVGRAPRTRRNLSTEKRKFFGFESYEETGRAGRCRDARGQDRSMSTIKNLPKGPNGNSDDG